MEYLRHWQFWMAVIVVAVVVNYAWSMFLKKSGKLV